LYCKWALQVQIQNTFESLGSLIVTVSSEHWLGVEFHEQNNF
jgi:hypothetical protein